MKPTQHHLLTFLLCHLLLSEHLPAQADEPDRSAPTQTASEVAQAPRSEAEVMKAEQALQKEEEERNRREIRRISGRGGSASGGLDNQALPYVLLIVVPLIGFFIVVALIR